MESENLIKRRQKTTRLMSQALQHGYHHKVAQARYILHMIDSRLFSIHSFPVYRRNSLNQN